MKILSIVIIICLVLFSIFNAQAQIIPAESSKATVTQRLGLDDVTITYNRPNIKNRKIWGALVPYGKVWRTGADYPTFITFTETTKVEGKSISPGKYALYTIPNKNLWVIIFSKNLGLWGAFGYKQDDDVLRLEVKPKISEFTETFTIGFSDISDDQATINLQWERVKVPIRIAVDIYERVLKSVKAVIDSGKADTGTYWRGANYLLKHKRELELAMAWVDKSIQMEEGWMNLWTKALIFVAQQNYKSALEYGKKAFEKGKMNSEYFPYKIPWAEEMNKWQIRPKSKLQK